MRPSFETSVEVKLLTSFLQKIDVGTIVTYKEMTAVIDRDILTHRSVLQSARRILERDNRMVFGSIHAVGIKLLSCGEVVDSADDSSARIGRISRRTIKRLSTIDESELTPEKRLEWHMKSSQLGAIALMTKPSALKALESTVKERKCLLPPAESLKLFAK